jgi:hypothetical protein
MEMGKKVAMILMAYATISIVAYVASGFPDLSCACPIKITIVLSTLASPFLIITAVLLLRHNGKQPKM